MASSQILVSGVPTKSDLTQVPVTIIGQAKNLTRLTFEQVSCKLEP